MLYELLSGDTSFDNQKIAGKGFVELIRVICEQ
jgi:hypothetical protein